MVSRYALAWSALVTVVLLAASSRTASAQTSYGLGAGVAEEGRSYYSSGFFAQGFVARTIKQGYGVRVDALLNHYKYSSVAPAFSPGGCAAPGCTLVPDTNASIGVGGLTVSAVIGSDRRAWLSPYVMVGVGPLVILQHPSERGVVRGDVVFGAGLGMRLGGRARAFVEVRSDRVISGPSLVASPFSLTFGFEF